MLKTIICKDGNRNHDIHYRIMCDICKKVYSEKGKVVDFDRIENLIDSDCYLDGKWFMHNGFAICPKCLNAVTSDIYDEEYRPKLNVKSWKTWVKKCKPKTVRFYDGNKPYFYNVVFPTMKKYGFKKYNEDSDYIMENGEPRDVVIRAIYRGGTPNKRIPIEKIEFVYYTSEYKNECPYVDIFWRKAQSI